MDKIEVNLSVHDLVDFVLRQGDIDSRTFNQETMQEGTRIHLRYQSIQQGNYESEVELKGTIDYKEYRFNLKGRADGIIHDKNYDIIDEIKSCNTSLDEFYSRHGSWHLGQAICYAYMLALEKNYSLVGIRLTYISQVEEDDETDIRQKKMIKNFLFSFDELKERLLEIIAEYLVFYNLIEEFHRKRNESASNLTFPYKEYRKGQREIAKYVYQVCKDGKIFFFEAPTGIGKTMSSLFPSLKTFKDDINEKIFYLSAKNQTKIVAYDAMETLIDHGLDCHSIVLSSREQMCPLDESKCNPEECKFARNYYSKLRDSLKEMLLKEKNFSKEKILSYCYSQELCPFKFELDLSLYCDVIICDYNYVFDPLVYLKRFFDEDETKYFVLIDEAHNLSERIKEMYSCSLDNNVLLETKQKLKSVKAPSLKKKITKMISYLDLYISNNNVVYENGFDNEFQSYLDDLYIGLQNFLKDHKKEVEVTSLIMDCFRMVYRFTKIQEYVNDDFVYYSKSEGGHIQLVIKCLNASRLIKTTISKLRGGIFFSATLTPLDYYIKTLGGDENTPYLKVSSPFFKDQIKVLIQDNISTKYKDRQSSYLKIAESIKGFVSSKVGNYLVYFPSYQYLEEVKKVYEVTFEKLIYQERDMNLEKKNEFLKNYQPNPTSSTVGFAVLGGSFAEGIDLTNDKLIGVIVVGVGLPMISFERDLIKNYYNKQNVNGYDYAYVNPGKNKVMQASGRLIRTLDDYGALLFIDERFVTSKYRDLFKGLYQDYELVRSSDEIKAKLIRFYNQFK